MSVTQAPDGATRAVELRVLTGPNAGAGLQLTEGTWLIGAGPDADLSFAEPLLAPLHLRIVLEAGGIRVTALGGAATAGGAPLAAGEEASLPLLTPVRIGETVFAIGGEGADWAGVPLHPPAPATPGPVAPVSVEEPPAVAAADPAREPLLPATPPAVARRRGALLWVIPGLVLLLAAGTAAVLFAWPAAKPAGPPLAEPIQQLREAVRGLGFQEAISVSPARRGNGFVVAGHLRDAEQHAALMGELRRTGLPVEVTVTTERGLTELSATILQAFDIEGEVQVTGPGAITVRGLAPDASTAEIAVARLRSDVPGLRSVADQLVTPERARETLEARLRSTGLARQLRVAVAGRRITVSGTLGAEQMSEWNGILAGFRRETGDRVAVESHVVTPASVAPRGVQLGRNPALVLDDGRRLRVGQVLEGAGRIITFDERRVRVQTQAGAVDLAYTRPPYWILEEPNAQ